MKQGFSYWCFENLIEARDLFAQAKEIGFAAVELLPERLFSLARDSGLRISAINGHNTIENGLNDAANHDRIELEILVNLKLAEKWAIPNLICFSGNKRELDFETGAQITAEGLARVAQHAEDAGVNLILELLNSKVDHPDYQCDNTKFGLKVCELVNSSRVKLLYDIYHMQIMEGDIIRTIQQHHSSFAHYHTAGNPGRKELDSNQEINYPAIAKAISSTGFDGFVTHEFVPKHDPISGLEQAFRIFASTRDSKSDLRWTGESRI
jgi:hydroxypyruvate isomerase